MPKKFLVKSETTSSVPFRSPYDVHCYQASFAGPRKRKQPSMNSLVATAGKDFYFTFAITNLMRIVQCHKNGWKRLRQKLHMPLRGCSWNSELSASVGSAYPPPLCNWDPWTSNEGHLNPLKKALLNYEEDTGRNLVHECVYDICMWKGKKD